MKRKLLTGMGITILFAPINAEESNRPNIIFILTDDQRWDAMGYAGNTIIHTPEMDKLAKEGTYFRNSFVTTPISAASRASIMTGMYERTHGFTFQQPPIRKELIELSYFSFLKKAGYYNGFLGKFGVEFENKLDTSLFDVYQPEGANFYWRLKDDKHFHLTDLMGKRSIDFIKNAPSHKPFCLSISFNAPHAEDRSPDQYIWPKDFDTLYQNVRIPEPRMAEKEWFLQQPEYVQKGLNRVRWYWRYDTPDKYQQMVKGYYRMISAVDRNIGNIRKALVEKGIDKNTIIIFMGDNGYFLGERQLAGKWLMYENSLRVPLIIYDPRVNKHFDIDEIGLNIDIAPTILDYAGISIPNEYQGLSLKEFVRGAKPQKQHDAFICEHLWKYAAIPASEGIRTRKWKYFRYIDDPERIELYDLSNDPWEMHNLANDPNYKTEMSLLQKQFDTFVDEIK